MSFCRSVCPWAVKQSRQWSTWRGLLVIGTTLAAAFNPVMGLAVGKISGAIIGAVEVAKDDSKIN